VLPASCVIPSEAEGPRIFLNASRRTPNHGSTSVSDTQDQLNRLQLPPCRARNVVRRKPPFRAVFFQPLIANRIGKNLDFEYADIDGAPIQAVNSMCKIASAARALAKQNRPAVLFDSIGIVSPGPDVSCIFDLGTSRTKFTREVSGEVEESMPEIPISGTAFARRVWSIALFFQRLPTDPLLAAI